MSFNRVQLGGGARARRFASCLALFTLLSAGASLVRAQEETYACLQGVPGDSVNADHMGWIVAYGLDHGSSYGTPSTFTDVSILKGTDLASVKLHQYITQGIVLPKVVIDVCRPGGGATDCYYTLVLENVRLTQVDVAGSACVDTAMSCTPAQTESVSFDFEKITWVYEDGTDSYCHDLMAGAACAAIPTTDCTP